jgi:hypothetical protein
MRNTKAIILFTQQVRFSRGDPNEPFAAIAWDDIDVLFSAMLNDLVEQIIKITNTDIFISVNSSDMQDDFLLSFQRKVNVLDHSSLSFPQRISSAINTVFENDYHRLILYLQHYPLLVLGASKNGRASLLGVKSNYSDWFKTVQSETTDKSDTSFIETDYILKKACGNEVLIFNTPTIPAVDNGFDLEKLKRNIEHSMTVEGFFAKHTYEIFKYIDKKYFNRKRKDEAWDTRRHI